MPSELHHNKTYPLGPCEPNIAVLPDGHTVVIVARMMNGAHLWQASSTDQGRSWSRMGETAAWAVYPQLITLGNGAVLLASGRPGLMGLWVLDQSDLAWASFRNLAAAHNQGLPAPAPAEDRFPESYAAIDSVNATADFHQPLSKAYLGLYELGCDGRACGAASS